MFVLAGIPLLFGYLVATRVVRERWWQLRLPVAYALAVTAFLLGVNVLIRFMPLRRSVFATVILLAILTIALFWLRPASGTWVRVGTLDASVLILLATTAAFLALFWHMKHFDDDFYPHAPTIAAFLRDVFPPRNPLYADRVMGGHYGRDITIAALSTLFSDRFFPVEWALIAINHAGTVLIIYFASRRFCRSTRAAMLGTILAFLGVNDASYWHTGLLDTFHNNNTFVYLLLFLNAYLYFIALTRRDTRSIVVCAISLATYSVVYETHFGILVLLMAGFPIILLLRRARWRPSYVVTTASILITAAAIASFEGGPITDIAQRFLSPASRTAPREDTQAAPLLTHQVTVRFPKWPLKVTSSWDGEPYPLVSLRLVREAGYFVPFLPLLVALMLVFRIYWGLFVALMGLLAILVPASVDFGAFNGESFRFLFFGGMASAMTCGIALGCGLDRVARGGRVPRWAAAGVVALLVAVCWLPVWQTAVEFVNVARRGEDYYWNPEEWACGGATKNMCDVLDARIALDLHSMTRPGDRILTNAYVGTVPETFIAHSIISTFSGAFVDGHGLRLPKDGVYAMGKVWSAPAGFRAIAFWNTADPSVLQRMSVNYLLVDPERLSPKVNELLRQTRGLERVARREDAARAEVREAYRVKGLAPVQPEPVPTDLSVVSVVLPSPVWSGDFYRVPFVVKTGDPLFTGRIEIGHRIFYGTLLMNATDEIRHVIQLERKGTGLWSGRFFLVAPFEGGDYQLDLYAVNAGRPVPMRLLSGGQARWTLMVAGP